MSSTLITSLVHSYNSAVYLTKPANEISMYIVTPDFLTGGPADSDAATDAYDWRKSQLLSGLEVSHKSHRSMVTQRIDGGRIVPYGGAMCVTNNCSRPRDKLERGIFTREVDPLTCLNAFADPFGNRSDVIFVTDHDYLSGKDIGGVNGSNTLLFTKFMRIQISLSFWADYDWLCGATNSFDCRLLLLFLIYVP